ncbi:MAG: hypothetical protein M1503_12805 [Thaumarchaeota archaeon]|nr:hypothetical protein [Nitrososphaerota archaeon]MCL5319119.1 hypothetical protein [Nitrososphaerota archaeon]
MHETSKIRVAALILIPLLFVLSIEFFAEPQTASTNTIQTRTSTTSTTTTTQNQTQSKDAAYSSLVRSLFDQVLKDVSSIRELPAPSSTTLQIVSIRFFQNRETQDVQRQTPTIRLEDIVYRALFMMPQNYSVGTARVAEAGKVLSAVAGTKLYIVKEYFNPENNKDARRTLAHEITHILQSKFKPPKITTFDQSQAWIALIEGDADFTADTYVKTNGPFATAYAYSPIPNSLDRITGFPYSYGSSFVEALYSKGGWSLVNSAYSRPPRSSKEILHPDAYLAGNPFTKVAALTTRYGVWNTSWTNTGGEYFIRIMLENGVPTDIAETAAKGWNGDNLTLFSRSNTYLVTWRISWETEADALEFYQAYQSMLTNMGGEKSEPNIYHLLGHYVTVTKNGAVTEIISSTDQESVASFLTN